MLRRRGRPGASPTQPVGRTSVLQPDRTLVAASVLAATLLAGCAAPDTFVADEPRTATEQPIAPYAFHEECAALQEGAKLDYHFEAKAPVTFQIYYREGNAFISTVNRDDVTEFGGVFSVPAARRYCLRWDAGPQGAVVDFRIRLRQAKP